LQINKATAGFSVIGSSGLNMQGGGISFHSNGTLYGLLAVGSSAELYTINTTTGAISVVSAFRRRTIVNSASFRQRRPALVPARRVGGTTSLKTVTVGLTRSTIGNPGVNFDALGWSVTVVAPGDPPVGTGGVRIAIAFDDPTFEPDPAWTYLTATENLTAGYTIDAGRQYEFDKTDGSTATIRINDVDGVLDPTNAAGPYYGLLEPLLAGSDRALQPGRGDVVDPVPRLHRGLRLHDRPVAGRDAVGDHLCRPVRDPDAIEMQPTSPATFGDAGGTDGTIFFDNASASDRIAQVLTNAGIPADFYVVFSLNVNMQEYGYSGGQNPLEVVQDCADAEMPTVSNVYCDRTGRLAVHGRFAKFDPVGTAAGAAPGAWLFTYWKCGDGAAVSRRRPTRRRSGRWRSTAACPRSATPAPATRPGSRRRRPSTASSRTPRRSLSSATAPGRPRICCWELRPATRLRTRRRGRRPATTHWTRRWRSRRS
jgi:hypothetical protein